jgi:hypothetical protein
LVVKRVTDCPAYTTLVFELMIGGDSGGSTDTGSGGDVAACVGTELSVTVAQKNMESGGELKENTVDVPVTPSTGFVPDRTATSLVSREQSLLEPLYSVTE